MRWEFWRKMCCYTTTGVSWKVAPGSLHPQNAFLYHDYRLREFVVTPPEGIRVLTTDESGEEVLAGLAEVEAGSQDGKSIRHYRGKDKYGEQILHVAQRSRYDSHCRR